MRPAHFSFVSELMLILLFYVCLPHLFVFMVHSLEVSPFPCYPNDADCEASVPYHREAHQQLFEVWLKQSDDSEKQSYVYVDEQPDGMDMTDCGDDDCGWYMQTQSFTNALVNLDDALEIKVMLCSSGQRDGDAGRGQLCYKKPFDYQVATVQCFMSQCEVEIMNMNEEYNGCAAQDGNCIVFRINRLSEITGSKALSIEPWGSSPELIKANRREALSHSLFVFFQSQSGHKTCKEKQADTPDANKFKTFNGPDPANGRTGYHDLTNVNNPGVYILGAYEEVCLEMGAYVYGFLRSEGYTDDGYCGDSTGSRISGFGGMWRSGYGNKGGQGYTIPRIDDAQDIMDALMGTTATIEVCGGNEQEKLQVKDVVLLGAIGANENVNVNPYWRYGQGTHGYVKDLKILGTWGYSTDGIGGTGVDGVALDNFIMCGDDALKPMEDYQIFDGNVVWQATNGFAIMFGWNYATTEKKSIMNTDIWRVDHFGDAYACSIKDSIPQGDWQAPGDSGCLTYRAVVGALYSSACDEVNSSGHVNNLRIMNDVMRLFSFQVGDAEQGGVCPHTGDAIDTDELLAHPDWYCDATDWLSCSRAQLKDFHFGLENDDDDDEDSGWGINVYGYQDRRSILWGPKDDSISGFKFGRLTVNGDKVCYANDNIHEYFKYKEFVDNGAEFAFDFTSSFSPEDA